MITPALVLLLAASMAGQAPADPGQDDAPGRVGRLDEGLRRVEPAPDLSTPQASLENFIDAADRGDYDRAAYSLDLRAIPFARRAEEGPALARRLKAVMDAQVWFRWDEVPDRPDGQVEAEADETPPGSSPAAPEGEAEKPGPRSYLKLYTLFIGDRDYEVRLERVKPDASAAAWVFSRRTVARIPLLFEHFGPSGLERALPEWSKRTKLAKVAVWQWAGFALIVLAGFALGQAVQRALDALIRRFDSARGRVVAEAIRGPGVLTIGLWSFHELARRYLGLARPIASVLEPFYLAVMIASLTWFLRRLIGVVALRVARRYESFDNDEGNVLLTRLSVARHALTFLVIVGGIALILGRFAWFRQVGTTVLASAGVAGVVLGVAAQRVLGNLFSGFLLAVTQPVKTGDAILFEGVFGWVEEIDVTYLVIRSWDLRRVVVPLGYLLDKPFENWSRGSLGMIKPVTIHADYRVDVEAVRAELRSILESSPGWDREVPPILQVTECGSGSIELRALASARDPAAAWDLHCDLRERLVAFLRTFEGGRYLPRTRVALVEGAGEWDGPAPDDHRGAVPRGLAASPDQ